MFDDFPAYFRENVIDTYLKFKKQINSSKLGRSNDLKLAINLANVLFHLREHLPDHIKITRKEIEQGCPDYKFIGDIANVSKHRKITHNNPSITKAENIYEQLVFIEFEEDDQLYLYRKEIIAVLDNGLEKNVGDLLTNLINWWNKKLQELNLTNPTSIFSLYKYYNFGKPNKSKIFKFEILQGLRFNVRMKFVSYNKKKEILEPVNLSGSTIEFNVYEKLYPIEINIKHNELGIDQSIEIKVNEKEKNRLLNIKDENKRISEFLKIAKEQNVGFINNNPNSTYSINIQN